MGERMLGSKWMSSGLCVYFTFLHLVNYLTVDQQVGHEARENHNGQRQVISVSGKAF